MLFLASVGSRRVHVGASGTETQSSDADISRKYAGSRERWGIFSFRGLPCASGLSIFSWARGRASPSSNALSPGDMRILYGDGLLLASVSFRGRPVFPYMLRHRVRIPEVQTNHTM